MYVVTIFLVLYCLMVVFTNLFGVKLFNLLKLNEERLYILVPVLIWTIVKLNTWCLKFECTYIIDEVVQLLEFDLMLSDHGWIMTTLLIIVSCVHRFPCRIGTCQSPVEVMACAGEILPEFVVKALLYPGAVKRALIKGAAVPSPDQLLHPYKFKKGKPTDLKHLEVCLCIGMNASWKHETIGQCFLMSEFDFNSGYCRQLPLCRGGLSRAAEARENELLRLNPNPMGHR